MSLHLISSNHQIIYLLLHTYFINLATELILELFSFAPAALLLNLAIPGSFRGKTSQRNSSWKNNPGLDYSVTSETICSFDLYFHFLSCSLLTITKIIY